MNSYSKEDLDKMKKDSETNEKLEEFFNNRREFWTKTITPLYLILKFQIDKPSDSYKILEAQSLALTYRQEINEEISKYLERRSSDGAKLKREKERKFLFFATGFGVKTSYTEKAILIDAHISEMQRSMELIEIYIEFLRDTLKNLEGLGYSIKNLIELLNYLK